MESKYNLRGVSADKEDVHAAIINLDKGLFPSAFVKFYLTLLLMTKNIAILCMQIRPGLRLH